MKLDLASLLAVAALIALGYCAWEWSLGGPMVTQMQPGRFLVSNDRYRYEYRLDHEQSTASGVLTLTDRQGGASEGGAVLTLHYLSEASLAEFRGTQDPSTCLAPFFNRHAEHRILIPANPEVEQKLRSLNFSNYSKVSAWRRFATTGYCIESAPVVSIDGKTGRMPANMFDNCLTMVATGIDVRDQLVLAARDAK